MTIRDRVMDKFWLEFLEDNEGDLSTWHQFEAAFWHWFYNEKMKKHGASNIEDFLK